MARRPSAFGIRQNHQAREQRASDVKQVFILFSIVIILVICHSLRVVLNVEEFIDLTSYKEQMEKGCNGRKFWHEVLVRISQLLIIINSSANFFIYVFMDNGFRNVLRHIGTNAHSNNFNIGINQPTITGLTEDRRISRSNDMEQLNNINVHITIEMERGKTIRKKKPKLEQNESEDENENEQQETKINRKKKVKLSKMRPSRSTNF